MYNTMEAAGIASEYDIRMEKCSGGALCYDFSSLTQYLAQPKVQEALGVVGRSWSLCNFTVYDDFSVDIVHDVSCCFSSLSTLLHFSNNCVLQCLQDQEPHAALSWPHFCTLSCGLDTKNDTACTTVHGRTGGLAFLPTQSLCYVV